MTIPDSSAYSYMMENGSIELPCMPEEERRIVQELTVKDESNKREGNLYFVVCSRWYREWQRYTGLKEGAYPFEDHSIISRSLILEDRPGVIDNSGIIDGGLDYDDDAPQLFRTLMELHDYVLVPQEVWEKLLKWYKGGPALPRKMISVGDQQKQFVVEVFPLSLQLTDSRDLSEVIIRLSRKASIHDLYVKVCQLKGLQTEKACIWDYFNKEKRTILMSSSQTLQESNLVMDQNILLEVPADDLFMDSTGNGLALVPVEPIRFPFSIAGGPTMSSGNSNNDLGMDSTGNGLALVPVEPIRLPFSIAGGPTMSNGNSTDDLGMDSTGNGLALVPVESIRLPFSIAGGHTMSNGNSTACSSSLYQTSTSTSTYGDMEIGYDDLKPVTRGVRGGLAGLPNLGNTCFMNSALQCLVHTPNLADYFLQDYSDEINEQNPLGMHGELALAFGYLLRKLWSSGGAPVDPRVFKGKLARFAPQFSGYSQHDSQELLAFLLDGLHEDLNRVKQKPYIETKDFDGQPNEEVADEFWRYHKARNDSIIVDTCQGQYKSTLICPVCNKISITFDPFMYLSLPLPSSATRSMTITVFYGDGSGLPMPVTVTVLKEGCCKDLIKALGIACSLGSDEYLLLAEVYRHRIYRYLENPSEALAKVQDEEHIVAYRLFKKDTDLTRIEICHRYQEIERKMFLTPLVTYLEDPPQSGADIDIAVDRVLSPLRRKSFLTSTTIHCNGENGCDDDNHAMGDQMEISGTEPEHEFLQSREEMEPKGISNRESSFQLCITNDMGYGCWPIVKNSPIKPGRIVKVLLDWTEKEHELYDASYLKDLPEVHKAKKMKQETVSLFSCLDAFLKEEPLSPDDMWYCPRCKEHRQASKKLDLWRLPDILVFHLKRFSHSRWLTNKLDKFVNFPIQNLDLSRYVKSGDGMTSGSHVYELYAISNHYGGLGGGHYTAYCKLIDEDRWYDFNDAYVSPINESEIKTSAAYVLFYRRVKNLP
ncbi:ubiquitin carboxyl-terminal hydrolase [Striga asiatica]|uniref:Ubiquitin carboxyl-terminal hydrolase n=1 Tax=Striga asiatica TaxID=4170 RepID=A0A5A7QEA9_STRAF|nr:ubiquitin carboxyl-terminal hydrolase [Striga asiatica]